MLSNPQKLKTTILLTASLLLFIFSFYTVLPCYSESKPVIRAKVGLALGGGGARGAAHIGVLRVLERENIPIDYLVGTSVGSLIAALYSGGISLDEMNRLILSGIIKKLYKTNFSVFRALYNFLNKITSPISKKTLYPGLYNDHKLHNFVDKIISMGEDTINLNIPLNIIAVDLVTGVPVVIESGDVGLAVQASTAIPILRQPIPMNNQLLVDGGVLRNVPVEEARKMGADIVIAVDVDEKQEPYQPQDFKSYTDVISRILQLGLRAQSEFILNDADIVIKPNLKGIGILDLDSESLTKAIKAGEDEATKMIPEIKKKINLRTQALKLYF